MANLASIRAIVSTVVPQLFHSCSTVAEQNTVPNQALQVFVQVLDSCFENVCELDLIYHFDRAWDLGKSQLICLASKTILQRIDGRHVSSTLAYTSCEGFNLSWQVFDYTKTKMQAVTVAHILLRASRPAGELHPWWNCHGWHGLGNQCRPHFRGRQGRGDGQDLEEPILNM